MSTSAASATALPWCLVTRARKSSKWSSRRIDTSSSTSAMRSSLWSSRSRRGSPVACATGGRFVEFGLGRLFQSERPVPGRSCRRERKEDDARRRRPRVDEGEPGGERALGEQPLPAAEHNRKDPDAELVDEVVLQQRLDQVRAPVHLQLGTVLFFEARRRVGDVALEKF